MTSPSDRSVRPLSSTEGGAADIAGQGGIGQAEATKGDGINGEIDEQEEDVAARDPRVARRPIKPTKAMVQSHELHHAVYRDWCDHCRAGKGVSHQHRSSEDSSRGGEFSIDDVFMTREGAVEMERDMKDADKVGATPILVGCDHQSKAVWAMATSTKGPTDSAVKWLTKKIDQAGYRGIKVVLKSDQEESIMALKRAVAIVRQAPTVNIESPVRDSQANGNAERAVRTWAAQVRTIRHHLEFRMQCKVPIHSPVMTWLVSWAAEVICRYRVQANGRTSYENVTGHKGLQPVAIFGEKVMFRFTPDKTNRRKMESDWSHGYFLGINPETTEYLIGTHDNIYSCCTMRRLEEDRAFDATLVKTHWH